jgi:hyperosmotically inducible periplasmic protein
MSSRLPVTLALVGALVFGGAAVALNAQTPAQTPAQRDDSLKDQIAYRLETNPTVKKYDIKVKVENNVATLTGDVATAAQKAEAGKLAKVNGVTTVNNQIVVDPNEDKTLLERTKSGLAKTGEAITDVWITTKVKWFFVGEDLLKGSHIDVDTSNKVVTLKGTVKSAAGRARAVQLAKDTDGVTRVVDQLTIGG